jgi:hypothetical protein
MLTYTATDLVELIRRDMDAAVATPRVNVPRGTGVFQQIRQRLALGRPMPR